MHLTPSTGERGEVKWWCDTYNKLQPEEPSECPFCHGKGVIAAQITEEGRNYKGTRPCACMKQNNNKAAADKSGLGVLLKRHTLENYATERRWQKEAKFKAEAYIKDPQGAWFVVTGKPGTGKTHLCVALCGKLLEGGKRVKFFSWRGQSTNLKGWLASDFGKYEKAIAAYKEAPVLYIDDFWKGSRVSDGDINLAIDLIYDRYNSGKLTIISSEKGIGDISGIDEGIGSRIAEKCRGFFVQTEGENVRARGR